MRTNAPGTGPLPEFSAYMLTRFLSRVYALLQGICFVGVCHVHGVELVVNGSFKAKGDVADGWAKAYGGYSLSQIHIQGGENSLRITGGTNALGIGGAQQIIRGFQPGAVLKFQAHIYIEEFSAGIIKPIHVGFNSRGRAHFPHVNLIYASAPTAYRLRSWLPYEMVLDLSQYPDVEEITLYTLTWALKEIPFQGVVYVGALSVTDVTAEVTVKKQLEQQLAGSDRPVLYAQHTATPPKLDGVLDDAAWRHSLRYGAFKKTDGTPAKEQTEFMLCRDKDYLYVGVKASASALNPANNLLHAFRDKVTQRKGPVPSDDSIEFFFAHDRMEGYYQIVANIHTTWERHRTSSRDDTTWMPDVRVGGRKHLSERNTDDDAYYVVEAAFSLQSLDIDPKAANQPIRFNLARVNKANPESSLWPRLSSFHEHKNYPCLVLGDKEIGGAIGDGLNSRLELTYSTQALQDTLAGC